MAINDLDESAPTITSGDTATALDENSGAGQIVYTATATDTDDISNGVTFSLSGADAGSFTIDSSTGEVTLTGDPDFETKPSYSFDVVATDAASNSSTQAVTLAINDVNEFPIFFSSDNSETRSIPSNSAPGTPVGIDVDASDGDGSTTVSFSLARNVSGGPYEGSEFTIDSSTGVVSVGAAPPLFIDGGLNTRTVYVLATSTDGSRAVQQFTVLVTNAP